MTVTVTVTVTNCDCDSDSDCDCDCDCDCDSDSKIEKIVPYDGSARIPRLTVSIPGYGSWHSIF